MDSFKIIFCKRLDQGGAFRLGLDLVPSAETRAPNKADGFWNKVSSRVHKIRSSEVYAPIACVPSPKSQKSLSSRSISVGPPA